MRVLWISPLVPAALRRPDTRGEHMAGGSWIPALEQALRGYPGIDLHVAALAPVDHSVVDRGVTYHGVRSKGRSAAQRLRRNWGMGEQSVEETHGMLELVADTQPDVIHIHGTEQAFASLLTMTSVPSLVSMQGILTVCERMSTRELEVWPGAWLGDVPGLLKGHTPLTQRRAMRISALRERRVLAEAAFLGGRTEWDRLVASILAPQATYFHCGEVLRPEFYEASWAGPRGSQPVVYSTIGAAPYKGAETLIEAAALAARRGHLIQLRLGGIGDDSVSGRAAQRIARRLGISGRVSLLGYLTAAEIVDELRHCSAYASPSHIDNSPNALCEALVMGVPCVATAVGGVPSLLSPDEGWLVQDGDPWHMAAALSEILERPETASGRGARAQTKARERHDPVSVCAGVVRAYETIARQTGRRQ